MRYLCFSIISFLFCVHSVHAQIFGGNPATTKWKQIDTDTVKIVFPSGQDSLAQQIASVIHWEQRIPEKNLGNTLSKINIVLQPDVTYSNGYVGLGPYRSEYYLMPPLNAFGLGAQSWAANLAIHEDRHVQQYNNFKVGWSKYASWIFGQDGQALLNAAAIPNWFFEGDAVYNETRLSAQGRGRLPLFLNNFKALELGNRHYSFMKLRNGSYRDFVPDHYALGYILVSYGYAKYGDDFWRKVTQDAAAFKPIFYPLQNAIKKYSGKKYVQFVNDAFRFYDSVYGQHIDTSAQWVTGVKKSTVVNYLYPQYVSGHLYALKTDYNNIPVLVRVDSAGSNKIATQSINNDNYFATNGRSIVYAGWRPDIRWGNKNYSEIRLLDIQNRIEKCITYKTRYFTPYINDANDKIVAVSLDNRQQSALVELSLDGHILSRKSIAAGSIASYPLYYRSDIVYVERNPKGEMAILKYLPNSNRTDTLISLGNHIIGYPTIAGDTLFYTMSYEGSDRVFAYLLGEHHNCLVANYATGLYHGTMMGDSLVASAFTADGYRLVRSGLNWRRVMLSNHENDLQNLLMTHVDSSCDFWTASIENRLIRKYSKWTNPINFHSLHPEWDDPVYGLTLYGQNILNTIQTNLFYNYNRNEKYSQAGGSIVFGGIYVQPVIGITGTFQRAARLYASSDSMINWNEYNMSGGLQLPLNFSSGKYYRYLTISSLYRYNNIYMTGWAQDRYANYHFNYQDSRLSYSMYSQTAYKQLAPRAGFSINLQARNGYTAKAWKYLVYGNVYLPGVLSTHSIVLNYGYAARDTFGNYSYTNNFSFSRGYNNYDYPRMYKLGFNYQLPLCYPDWGVGQLVYFLRVRANLFYDYTLTRSLSRMTNYNFNSTGAEIYFDTKWWNQEPITFGLRYSRMLNFGFGNRWEIILPVSIFN